RNPPAGQSQSQGNQAGQSSGTTTGTSTSPATPSAPEDGDTAKADPSKDYQLSRALDLLHGIALGEASKANGLAATTRRSPDPRARRPAYGATPPRGATPRTGPLACPKILLATAVPCANMTAVPASATRVWSSGRLPAPF